MSIEPKYLISQITSLEEDLLPCPFCGKAGQLCKRRTERPDGIHEVWNVGCSSQACIAYRPNRWDYDPTKVRAEWNARN
jgi:hypothetical protein